jgi:hypothetical protein
MKNNYLTQGDITKVVVLFKGEEFVCLIDREDLELIKSIGTSWHINNNGNQYKSVRTDKQINGKKKSITMANLIMPPGTGEVVDHINRNPLDNRKKNLRIIPAWGNSQNISMLSNNKSGVRGVSWHKPLGKWRAKAAINKKHYHLGYYGSVEEAEKVVTEFRKQRMPYSQENIMRGESNEFQTN